jgi:putative aldouronate transport system permease protein
MAANAKTDVNLHTLSKTKRSLPVLLSRVWYYRAFYLMLLPAVAYYIIFHYVPMYGAIISFKKFSPAKGILGSAWADPWYKYFEYFVSSPFFVRVFTNSLIISCFQMIFGILPPILLAIIFNECNISWFKRLGQTISYLPHFLSWVIIYGLAVALLSQDGGIINTMVKDMGGKPVGFLTSEAFFRPMIVGVAIWKEMGWGAIIYLAAMTNVDPGLYEAAEIDGASRLKRIWYITLPSITTVFVMLLILRVGNILNAGFDEIFVFLNPLVMPVGDIIDTWVYREGLINSNFSLASAVGLSKSVVGFVLIVITNKIANKWGEGVW